MTPLLAVLLKIGFGALAGGITNTLAVWMLFHPYRPPKLFGRWTVRHLQGAIPKSQPRLAKAVGGMVGNRLLTPADLADTFGEPEFRRAFDTGLAQVIDDALNTRHGSLRELVPESVSEDLARLLEQVAANVVSGLEEYIGSESFTRDTLERTRAASAEISSVRVGRFLTPGRTQSLQETAGTIFKDVVAGKGIESAVGHCLESASQGLVAKGTSFEEALPADLIHPVEEVISAYLPLAAGRLGELLDDRAVRKRVESAISEVIQRFVGEQAFPKRVMAKIFVNDAAVHQVVRAIRIEGADRLTELLRDSAVQQVISRRIREGIADLARRPIAEVVGPEAVAKTRDSLGVWLVDLIRNPATREFLDDSLLAGVDNLRGKTWGEVMEYVPPEKIAGFIVDTARSDGVRRQLERAVHQIAGGLVDRPVGLPAEWLPADSAERIEKALGDPLWDWLQTQIPSAVRQIDISSRVEAKVLNFPMSRVEQLIRQVSRREISLIIRLGFLLGGAIGGGLALVEMVLG